MSKRAEVKEKFMSALIATGKQNVTFEEIKQICDKEEIAHPYWFTNDVANREKRGVYKVPSTASVSQSTTIDLQAQVIQMPKQEVKTGSRIANVLTQLETENLVPSVYKNYVPFGHFDDLINIVSSNQFFPIFITGNSGNGKTMSVEQACAKLKRKFVCISMTPETDESDLLGNYILINGQMEWRDGPVTVAARQGAVLCIDEIDYGAQNLSSLQRVLEGKPFLLKKKNEIVYPAEGFTIVATANTKGKGSEDGRYMFTNVLNEAFLERFSITLEQEYPPATAERRILINALDKTTNEEDKKFVDLLIKWAEAIRRTFYDGGVNEIISTRRLVHICEAYMIFNSDRKKAIQLCLNRFDADTKASFMDLYTKIDAEVVIDPNVVAAPTDASKIFEEIPF